MPNPPQLLFITIRSQEQLLFQDYAKALTSQNDKGIFDILPKHANFISLIKSFVRVHKRDGTSQDFTIEDGLLKIADDKVNIYLGIGNRTAKKTPEVK